MNLKFVPRNEVPGIKKADGIRVHFDDQGQDFLYWDIDVATGKVLDAQPFQAWIWTRVTVVNVNSLMVDGFLKYVDQTGEPFILKYPIAKIEQINLEVQS